MGFEQPPPPPPPPPHSTILFRVCLSPAREKKPGHHPRLGFTAEAAIAAAAAAAKIHFFLKKKVFWKSFPENKKQKLVIS